MVRLSRSQTSLRTVSVTMTMMTMTMTMMLMLMLMDVPPGLVEFEQGFKCWQRMSNNKAYKEDGSIANKHPLVHNEGFDEVY